MFEGIQQSFHWVWKHLTKFEGIPLSLKASYKCLTASQMFKGIQHSDFAQRQPSPDLVLSLFEDDFQTKHDNDSVIF